MRKEIRRCSLSFFLFFDFLYTHTAKLYIKKKKNKKELHIVI